MKKLIFVTTMIMAFTSTAYAGGKDAIVKHFIDPAEKTALDATGHHQPRFQSGSKTTAQTAMDMPSMSAPSFLISISTYQGLP